MRRILFSAVMVAMASAALAADRPGAAARAADDEARLAEVIAGRTAGPPQQCVQQRLLGGNRGFGENVIVFGGAGRTIYVNHTNGPCPRIDDWNTLVVRTTGSSLCANDLIHVVDLQSGVDYGACSLGDFTPFRREG
jgi:hypothetical protein